MTPGLDTRRESRLTLYMNENEVIEACARAAHEANRAYCIALGDTSQPAWDVAPEWQRSSCRAGVEGARKGNTPEQSHESWFAHKQSDGWVYGPSKDVEAKVHPCFLPYAELPPAQRAKDALFVFVVRSVADALRERLADA